MPPNILWVTLDAVRWDRLTQNGYHRNTSPFLSKLSEKSITFENAFSNSTWTLPSVASMFTGCYPSEHGMINDRKKEMKSTTLAQILSSRDYETSLITTNPYVNSTDSRKGFDQIFNHESIAFSKSLLPKLNLPGKLKSAYRKLPTLFSNLPGNDRTSLIASVVKDEILRMEEPFLCYVHHNTAHTPIVLPPEIQKLGEKHMALPPGLGSRFLGPYSQWQEKKIKSWANTKEFNLTPSDSKAINDLYDNAILRLDQIISKYYQFLEKNDLLENTILVIVADHGEMLGKDGLLGHQFHFGDPIIHVPLIVHYPPIGSGKICKLFETKNVFHMLLELIEGNHDHFFKKSSYIYGEWTAPSKTAKEIKKLNPDLFTAGRYIRTSQLKYIEYNTGKHKLSDLDNDGEELKNEDLENLMQNLMQEKINEIGEKAKLQSKIRDLQSKIPD